MHYQTDNIALYAENMVRLTPRLSLIPGVRIQSGTANMTGRYADVPDDMVRTAADTVSQTIAHRLADEGGDVLSIAPRARPA